MNAVVAPTHLLEADTHSVWLQGNKAMGTMVPGLNPVWEETRQAGADLLGGYTAADRIMRVKPLNKSGFVDLDAVDVFDDTVHTDGLITADAELILHANPADCGEIAVWGFSQVEERPIIGLIHASRKIVHEGGHQQAMDYLAEKRGLDPVSMHVRLSPSARVESYAFADIDPAQKVSTVWRDYVYQDEAGLWHIDFHQKTVDDLVKFGIPTGNIWDTGIDTIADETYASNYRENHTGETPAANGLFFALRS